MVVLLAAASCTEAQPEADPAPSTDTAAHKGARTASTATTMTTNPRSRHDWRGWVESRQAVRGSWDVDDRSACATESDDRIRVLLVGDGRDADWVAAGLAAYTRLLVEAGATHGIDVEITRDLSADDVDIVVPVAVGPRPDVECAAELLDPVSLAIRPADDDLLRWNFASLGELEHVERYLRQDLDQRGPVAIISGETAQLLYDTHTLDLFVQDVDAHFEETFAVDSVTEALRREPRAIVALGAGVDCITWIDQRGNPPDGEMLFLASNECQFPGIVEHQPARADGANVLTWTRPQTSAQQEPSPWWLDFAAQLTAEEARVLDQHAASFQLGVGQGITLLELLRSVGWHPAAVSSALTSTDFELAFDHPILHGRIVIGAGGARLEQSELAIFDGENGWIDTGTFVQP
ncbi:MAG: hypothetical protein GY926_00470 [bacterium]|nr:hypothetical protein [bacterium]